MAFFDLNIPYDPKPAEKQNRTKLVTSCMELGYTGIAYNRTIQGVMSDRDRCSIQALSPSSISSFLSLSPSFSASLRFRRELLGTSEVSPFRQYTRLTVIVETAAQGLSINSGNPVLKTYDIVAVRPMNQSAFDQACEKLEVDIIAIDFAEKLPFRLKMPAVKAAMKRGVYFEIAYSSLLGDAQVRRQVISNAKLLVSWTRGKNLIFSSGATCALELRGPYDAANLSHLFGLSSQLARAAVSKNCRDLMSKALRKKNFFKGAIKVEQASSDLKIDANELFPTEWLKWDPLSAGDSDLQLKDVFKSFSQLSSDSMKSKAIDFSQLSGHQSFIIPANEYEVIGASSELHKKGNDLGRPPEATVNLATTNSPNELAVQEVNRESHSSTSTSAICLEEAKILRDGGMVRTTMVTDTKSVVRSYEAMCEIHVSRDNTDQNDNTLERSVSCIPGDVNKVTDTVYVKVHSIDNCLENESFNLFPPEVIIDGENVRGTAVQADRDADVIWQNALRASYLVRHENGVMKHNNQELSGAPSIGSEVNVLETCETLKETSSRRSDEHLNMFTPLHTRDDFDDMALPSVESPPLTDGCIQNRNYDTGNDPSSGLVFTSSPGTIKAKHFSSHRSILFPLKRLLSPVYFKRVKKGKRKY